MRADPKTGEPLRDKNGDYVTVNYETYKNGVNSKRNYESQNLCLMAATFGVRLDEELAHWRLGYRALALVSFSQGAIMSLHYAATRPEGAAAIVAYAGRLVTPVVARSGTPLTLVHGVDDDVIPVRELERAASAFGDAGYPVDAQALPGVGHTISAAGAMLGRDALVRALAVGAA